MAFNYSKEKKKYVKFVKEVNQIFKEENLVLREDKARFLAKKYERDINDVYDIFNKLGSRK
jgi:ABC-type branched-subunit amino acid transport system ATPase component